MSGAAGSWERCDLHPSLTSASSSPTPHPHPLQETLTRAAFCLPLPGALMKGKETYQTEAADWWGVTSPPQPMARGLLIPGYHKSMN